MRPFAVIVLAAALLPGCVLASWAKRTPLPEGSREIKDVAYYDGQGFDDLKHRLNVYAPKGPGPHPVVMFVHGGAWIFGDRDFGFDVYGRLGHRLAERGIMTVVVSYRLAPGQKHPAQIDDVARATAFTLSHAKGWGGDPSRIFLMGHSAGAHLVSLLACDPRFLARVGASPAELRGVIALSGPYDVSGLGHTLMGGAPMVVLAFGEDRRSWRDASPATHLADGRPPPFLVAVGDSEPLILQRQARAFADALKARGVQVTEERAELKEHFTIVMDLGEEGDALGDTLARFVEANGAPFETGRPLLSEEPFAL